MVILVTAANNESQLVRSRDIDLWSGRLNDGAVIVRDEPTTKAGKVVDWLF